MPAAETFPQWLYQAGIREHALTPEQRGLLQGAFHFRQSRGDDYYSGRLLSHFLLHCGTRLKVAQVARLVGISRPTASRQQGVSSKEAVQQAHHRMDGRPHGKLLPRYAGAIAGFLCARPDASRADLVDFVDRTFGVRVSRIALYKFLKKFGLDHIPGPEQASPLADRPLAPSALADTPGAAPAAAGLSGSVLPPGPGLPPPFSSRGRSTPAPSC
ncbi:MAG TPA: hypothetical protein VHI93_00605 [Candidatus Thermoplasmatota archaeon]|nr:hypothetical protein [Candidatus Thermoplasmatota archaeon]